MGWPSMLEEISERRGSDLHLSSSRYTTRGGRIPASSPDRNRARELHQDHERLHRKNVLLTTTVASLSNRIRELEGSLPGAVARAANNADLRRALSLNKSDLQRERSLRMKAESDLENLLYRLRSTPEGYRVLMNAYSTPRDIELSQLG